MLPLWIGLFFATALASYMVTDLPERKAAEIELVADVSATNFIAYRTAVQKYLQANPAVTGTVSDASLATYWAPGFQKNLPWTNMISGGSLYIYSTTNYPPNTLDRLKKKSPDFQLLGTKNQNTGRLISYSGFDTGVALPASIPANALIMMGR